MNMYKNNYKRSVREFVNPWRIFTINDESATVMCDYPKGYAKPSIPIPYCEEAMTGFEYSFAGLLISEGYVNEGIEIVKSIRNRYDGKKRNPWNEIECGSNYARSMASFALVPIFSGFTFHLPKKYIGFNPVVKGNFKSMWSLGTAWGVFELKDGVASIKINFGSLSISSIGVGFAGKVNTLTIDGKETEFTEDNKLISFEEVKVFDEIIIKYC